jgi:hypothetical protein
MSRALPPALLAVVVSVLALAPAASADTVVLPDIDMHEPSDVVMTTSGSQSFVAFSSSVTNIGPGVLKVQGIRDPSSPRMSTRQILLDTNSVDTGLPGQVVPNVGEFEFSPSPSHFHWHYLHFEDYMLLSVPNLDFVAPTRKTGFCISGLNKFAYCEGGDPDALQLGWNDSTIMATQYSHAMGLVAKNGPDLGAAGDPQGKHSADDDYGATVEGQDIEITNVPNGRYCLSFTVNPENKIVEANYNNNGASRLIDVGGTPGGARTVSVPTGTDAEFEDSATCGLTKPSPPPTDPGGGTTTPPGGGTTTPPGGGTVTPPSQNTERVLAPLTKRTSAKLATKGLKAKLPKSRSVTGSCKLAGKNNAQCKVSFKLSGAPYRGTIDIKQKVLSGNGQWYYRLSVKRMRKTSCVKKKNACPASVKTRTLLGGVLNTNPVAAKRALAVPSGRPAPLAGNAWPAWALPKGSAERVDAYKPIGG